MFELIGRKLGINVRVIITDGSHPIGEWNRVLLEAEDVMAVLRNDPLAPSDLKEKSLMMVGILLEMVVLHGRRRKKACSGDVGKRESIKENGQYYSGAREAENAGIGKIPFRG